jgi:hypothetical protein
MPSTNHGELMSINPIVDAGRQTEPHGCDPAGNEPVLAKQVKDHLAAAQSLFEHTMTEEEAAFFEREKGSAFVPLGPSQTRILPPHEK